MMVIVFRVCSMDHTNKTLSCISECVQHCVVVPLVRCALNETHRGQCLLRSEASAIQRWPRPPLEQQHRQTAALTSATESISSQSAHKHCQLPVTRASSHSPASNFHQNISPRRHGYHEEYLNHSLTSATMSHQQQEHSSPFRHNLRGM